MWGGGVGRVFTVDSDCWLKSWLSVKGGALWGLSVVVRSNYPMNWQTRRIISAVRLNKEVDQSGPINLINRWDNHLPWLLCHQLQVVSWLMKLLNSSKSMESQTISKKIWIQKNPRQSCDSSQTGWMPREELGKKSQRGWWVGFFIGGSVVIILSSILIILGCPLGVYSWEGLMGKGDRPAS